MTKEEVIKNSYGEYWEDCFLAIKDNGWLNVDLINSVKGAIFRVKVMRAFKHDANTIKNSLYIRPKTLRGIETNNGWIKIESEAQYDELENGDYEWYNIKTGKYDKGDLWAYGIFTHYKLVPKLEIIPPIY